MNTNVLCLDVALLQKRKDRGGKIIARCPACFENGGDETGEHLAVFPDGKFACAAQAGDHAHRQRIFELIGRCEHPLPSGLLPAIRPRPAPKRADLLSKIKADFPSTVIDLWEGSPVRCDENLDDSMAFLDLFPANAILWIAPDIYQSGAPEHARFFRTREEWQTERFTDAGTRIAPSSFQPGSFSRNRESVTEHLFTVIETDEIGDGKKYADKDEFCSLIRWLREACDLRLYAIIDSGGKSLHAWFCHPGSADLEILARHADTLGLDSKFAEPAQPWRLPGVNRETSERRQCLIYLERPI